MSKKIEHYSLNTQKMLVDIDSNLNQAYFYFTSFCSITCRVKDVVDAIAYIVNDERFFEKTVYARMFLCRSYPCIKFATDLSQFGDYEDLDFVSPIDTFPLIVGNCSNGGKQASVHIQEDGKNYTFEKWYEKYELCLAEDYYEYVKRIKIKRK